MSLNQMKTWLDANPTVSVEEYSDGEQKLAEPVSSEPSIDAVVGEMAEAELEQNEINRDMATLNESQESLERYQDLLTEALDNGGISAESASFVRLGLERIESLYGMDEPMTPGLEAFGGSSSQMHATQVSVEKLSDTIKKGWEAIKRALASLMKAISDVVTKALAGVSRLEKRAKALEAKAKSLSGSPKEAELKLPNPGKVFAGDKFEGLNPEVILGLMMYTTNVLPEQVIKYVDNIASTISGTDPAKDGALDAAAHKLMGFDAALAGFPGNAVGSDKRFPDGVDAKRSDVMPGNVALYASHPKAGEGDELQKLRRLASDLRVELLSVPDAKAAPSEHTIKVPSPRELALAAAKITKVTTVASKAAGRKDSISQAIDKLVKAGDSLREKADKAEMEAEQAKKVEAILRATMAVQRMLGNSVNGVLAYGVRTMNAQLAVVERCIAMYGDSKDEQSATTDS